MKTWIWLSDPDTNGAIPLECSICLKGTKVQLDHLGKSSFSIQIPVDVLGSVLGDDLHG